MATEHSMIKATKQEFITYLGKEKDCIHEIKEKKSGAFPGFLHLLILHFLSNVHCPHGRLLQNPVTYVIIRTGRKKEC